MRSQTAKSCLNEAQLISTCLFLLITSGVRFQVLRLELEKVKKS